MDTNILETMLRKTEKKKIVLVCVDKFSVLRCRWVDIDGFFYSSFKPSVRCSHCCPQRNDFSSLDASGQHGLDLRS